MLLSIRLTCRWNSKISTKPNQTKTKKYKHNHHNTKTQLRFESSRYVCGNLWACVCGCDEIWFVLHQIDAKISHWLRLTIVAIAAAVSFSFFSDPSVFVIYFVDISVMLPDHIDFAFFGLLSHCNEASSKAMKPQHTERKQQQQKRTTYNQEIKLCQSFNQVVFSRHSAYNGDNNTRAHLKRKESIHHLFILNGNKWSRYIHELCEARAKWEVKYRYKLLVGNAVKMKRKKIVGIHQKNCAWQQAEDDEKCKRKMTKCIWKMYGKLVHY